MKKIVALGTAFLCMCAICNSSFGQAEVSGWGNLRGIRVGGQLVAFTTAIGVYNPDFSQATLSQREGPTHTTQYVRNGNIVTVGETLQYGPGGARGAIQAVGTAVGALGAAVGAGGRATTTPATNQAANPPAGRAARGGRGGAGGAPAAAFSYTMSYTDSAPGTCDVQIRLTSAAAQTIGGVYYFVDLPSADFAAGAVQLIGVPNAAPASLAEINTQGRQLTGNCTGIVLSGRNSLKVEVHFPKATDVVVQRNRGRGAADIQVYFPIIVGNTTAGQVGQTTFTLKASGDVDTAPVTVTVDPSTIGRTWDGIGGNYRIQSPRDQEHIQYILDNMRVAFGRVAMPWNLWQPDENAPPPLTVGGGAAPAGGRGGGGGGVGGVGPAMNIAQELAQRKIPMIISCWQPPNWAVLPNAAGRGGGGGGQRLDPAKYDDIAKSIGSYLVYLRDHYGAEPVLFSFNESNVGINVRQSPQDHDDAIKKLGAEFKSLGLKTKMLLGDTGDAPPVNFIQTALSDPEAVPFIGAISFHSWRGATDAQYKAWADAATKLGVPLIDAEGGNDAQASGYPNVFREEWYSLDEAAEYVRIMRICQPQAILEWQLTENYSVLSTDQAGALHPTQRFFNLKQFNLAPAGSRWISAESSNGLVLPAAFVEKTTGLYTVHMVNNGASRPVTLSGLPASVTKLIVYITDKTRDMAQVDAVNVTNGSVQFTLQGQTLTTLINSAQ